MRVLFLSDQYVQAAKFADGALDHRFDLFLDPDIGGDADGLRAELVADFRCHLFGRRAVPASDQQAGAFARHAPRYAMAQALPAAGDTAALSSRSDSPRVGKKGSGTCKPR